MTKQKHVKRSEVVKQGLGKFVFIQAPNYHLARAFYTTFCARVSKAEIWLYEDESQLEFFWSKEIPQQYLTESLSMAMLVLHDWNFRISFNDTPTLIGKKGEHMT